MGTQDTPEGGAWSVQTKNICRKKERSDLMNINDIATLVSSLGFPIVMCGMMAWYIKYMSDRHKEELNALSNVIADNTKVIEGLKQLITDRIA